jgi:hypothetical protein
MFPAEILCLYSLNNAQTNCCKNLMKCNYLLLLPVDTIVGTVVYCPAVKYKNNSSVMFKEVDYGVASKVKCKFFNNVMNVMAK